MAKVGQFLVAVDTAFYTGAASMNDAPPAPTSLAAVVSTLFRRMRRRVFDLTIDEVPDAAYRTAAEAHEALVRVSDAVLTRVHKVAEYPRRLRAFESKERA